MKNQLNDTVKKLSGQKSIEALVENFKQELTGGSEINLNEAFDRYLAKPRRKVPSEKQQVINRSQWNDFSAFIKDKYPEAYIKQLRDSGRYVGTIQYSRKYNNKLISHNYKAQSALSGRTINAFHKTLKSVFSKLQEDAGILYNPFNFEMVDNESESRDAFSPEELKLIGDNLNDFVKPIFVN